MRKLLPWLQLVSASMFCWPQTCLPKLGALQLETASFATKDSGAGVDWSIRRDNVEQARGYR